MISCCAIVNPSLRGLFISERTQLHLVQEALAIIRQLGILGIAIHHVNEESLNGVLQLLLVSAQQLCSAPELQTPYHYRTQQIRVC